MTPQQELIPPPAIVPVAILFMGYDERMKLTVVVLANTPAGAFGLEMQIAAIFLTSRGDAKAPTSRR